MILFGMTVWNRLMVTTKLLSKLLNTKARLAIIMCTSITLIKAGKYKVPRVKRLLFQRKQLVCKIFQNKVLIPLTKLSKWKVNQKYQHQPSLPWIKGIKSTTTKRLVLNGFLMLVMVDWDVMYWLIRIVKFRDIAPTWKWFSSGSIILGKRDAKEVFKKDYCFIFSFVLYHS